MSDTQRTKADLQALLSDGAAAHSTNRQLIRDLLVSVVSVFGDTLSGDLVIQGITAGRGNGAINGCTTFGAAALSGNTGVANTAFGFAALQNNLDAPGNTAIGYGSMGSFGTGNGANTAVGYQSASAHTTATQNVAIGYWALRSTSTGSNNTAVGYRAGMSMVSAGYCTMIGYAVFDAACGDFNTGIGGFAGTTNTGTLNTIGGYFSFKSSTSGDQNTTWGAQTLVANVSGSRNVAIGYFAGHYELGSDTLYVDNQDRANTAGDKAKAMFYGVFNAAPASQTLVINAVTTISQTLAVTGGIAGTLSTPAQPGITSLGTLSGLAVSGGGITTTGSIVQSGVAGDNQIAGRIRWTGLWSGANAAGTISQNSSHGIFFTSVTGSINDFNLVSPVFGSIMRVPTGTQNTVFAGAMTVTGGLVRIKASGTALVAGDFALSGGWGTTATIGTITGTDQAWQATVTSSGTGQAASPTITLTFHDGTWTLAPIVVSKMVGGTGTVTLLTEAVGATSLIITFQGTPVAGSTYVISSHAIGR